MRRRLALALLLAGCSGSSGSGTPLELGDPNPGLGAATLQAFQRGHDVFERRFTRAEGHGPDFNVDLCRSCHDIPPSPT